MAVSETAQGLYTGQWLCLLQ